MAEGIWDGDVVFYLKNTANKAVQMVLKCNSKFLFPSSLSLKAWLFYIKIFYKNITSGNKDSFLSLDSIKNKFSPLYLKHGKIQEIYHLQLIVAHDGGNGG